MSYNIAHAHYTYKIDTRIYYYYYCLLHYGQRERNENNDETKTTK